jgi:hypothetical protein
MCSHTIMVSIISANGFTREISLPGAGDLPHLADVFGLALALLPGSSVGAPLSAIPSADAFASKHTTTAPQN